MYFPDYYSAILQVISNTLNTINDNLIANTDAITALSSVVHMLYIGVFALVFVELLSFVRGH